MRRLLLVRHAPTSATRSHAFPSDEPLDDRGRTDAVALGARLNPRHATLSSPSLRCLQTAEAAGRGDVSVETALDECDFGRWAGRTLADVHADDPDATRVWMSDPASSPHGGESLVSFMARVGGWLERQATLEDGAVAITHGGVVKAAVVHALAAPIEAFWRIDVTPLAITELHGHDGRWTLTRVNCSQRTGSPG
jgi:broad specificity phosphatase PhoE